MFEFPWGRKFRPSPFWSAILRRTDRHLLVVIAGMGLALALTACQPAETSTEPPGAPSTDAALSQAEVPSAPAPDSTAPLNGELPADATVPEAALGVTNTTGMTDTAPVTPTKPAPTPTPLPTLPPLPPPSAALEPAATSLATQLSAFRAAVKERDMDTMLKLQRDLVATADEAAQSLQNDKSPEADTVRLAIADIRKGAAGDNNALDHAAAKLTDVTGSQSSGSGLGITVATAPVDKTKLMASISEELKNFQQALKDRKPEDALRLQGQLLNDLSQAEQATKQDKSEKGETIQAALSALRKGLNGDTESLAAAADALARVNGPANAPNQPNQANTDIQRIASSLRSKVDDFRTAAAGNSRTDLLRLQQQIIAEADQDSAAIASDQSSQAKALRDAISAVRSGVSGDLAKLDGARSALSKLAGDEQPVATVNGQQQPPQDLAQMANDLKDKVTAFQNALQSNDNGRLLNLQSELLARADQTDAVVKNASTKPAEEMRAAIASLRTAFAGDTSKLGEALVHLNAVTGGASAQTASAATAKNGATTAPVDLQPLANELRNQVNGLRDTGNGKTISPEERAKQEAAVKEAATKLNGALNGATDPKANRLRAAATAAVEAAGGDQAKIEAARKLLDEILQ